jgi:predicted nuclease of predicted toxin-antitoxin system
VKIVVDECCPAYIANELKSDGHDVIYVAEDAPSLKDNDILNWALREERIIVTEDRDFCELVFLNKRPTFGIVLVRIHPQKRVEKLQRVRETFANQAAELAHAMVTVTLTNTRIRPLK